jgi:NDP-sugar pyrophosphorylase family protein
MDAVIMAGGKGKRLRPLTYAIPKPLLPVGERPILEILLGQLKRCGFTKALISIGYKGELIRSYLGNGSRLGIPVEYIEEKEALGTAGALGLVRDRLIKPFLMVNGDILTKLDFSKLYSHHVSEGAVMTVGGIEYSVQIPFGVIENDNGCVRGITEKPTASYLVAGGVYALSPEALDRIGDGERLDVPDLMAGLVDDGKKVLTYRITDPWLDVGKMSDYERAAQEVASWESDVA